MDKGEINRYLADKEPNEKGFKYLKRVRRIGLILRAHYRFLDSSHRSPKQLQDFLSLLGQYNDQYWLHERSNDSTNLKQAIDPLDELSLPFNLADTESFETFAFTTLAVIKTMLAESRLPMARFHELRKSIRSCADILQVMASEDFGGKVHWLFASLLELSVRLGETHDEFVQKDLRKEIKYEEGEITVESRTRDQFLKLCPFLERLMGVN